MRVPSRRRARGGVTPGVGEDAGPGPCLVTGAQQGIGRAVALAMGRAGSDVAVGYLDDRRAAQAVAEEIRGLGRRAVVVQGDVSRPVDARRMVQVALEGLDGLGVLVNNAGVFPRVSFLTMTEAEWDHVLDVNLKGAFLCGQAAARVMVEAGKGGVIVNVASQAVRGTPLGVHYSASKAGVVGLTRAMALALAPHRIRVNAVAPGLTDTAQPRFGHTDRELTRLARATIPLGGRMAHPDDIAAVVVFLASRDARFVTGEVLHANGGAYMA